MTVRFKTGEFETLLEGVDFDFEIEGDAHFNSAVCCKRIKVTADRVFFRNCVFITDKTIDFTANEITFDNPTFVCPLMGMKFQAKKFIFLKCNEGEKESIEKRLFQIDS